MIAGVLADFMNDGLSPADIRDKLYSITHSRVNGGRNVLYNGEETPGVLTPASSLPGVAGGKPPS
jgi:hypothetical protein